ncbi:hypothetical protein EUTSA_v10005413mg [Eutrema salsugineum]|uniref:MADS-box domain-containing protein n=1 Tax=Eutrema salsugineum TaxID=72664 RepID=V4KVF7_EUTSA|nr:hypothetical protein EUTSA_v10005413mg [Eutrema salsugineum]
MGRRKVEIKRIDNKSSRQVTFSKRRNGLIEKARQLSILCESSIAVLVVFGLRQALQLLLRRQIWFIYPILRCTSGRFVDRLIGVNGDFDQDSLVEIWMPHCPLQLLFQNVFMTKIIDRYDIQHADDLKTLELAEKTRNYLPHKELLELVQSNLEEPNVDNVSVDSLISVEDQLETAMSVTRARKTELMMEFVKTLQEKLGKNTALVTDDERALSPASNSGNNPPETLSLLK